jgi:hypothetical protein
MYVIYPTPAMSAQCAKPNVNMRCLLFSREAAVIAKKTMMSSET